MRIGQGYDVHKLVEGRDLILGGVKISHTAGLLGHSDADVLSHAIMDALLGALAMGDIGKHFPDNDPASAGADSIALLRQVGEMVVKAGWQPANIDSTIAAQAPKLAPHIPEMRRRIADALRISLNQVSVKATTEEGLGITGQGEGMTASAIVLLQKMPE